MGKAVVAAVIVLAIAAAPARADETATGTTDPAGDCTASPCADLVSVSPSIDRFGTLRFVFNGAGFWLDFNHPPQSPVPQIWIWTTSPDTGPPDATITQSGAHVPGAKTFVVRTENAGDPDIIGATHSLAMEVGEGPKNDIPGFLTALGGPFRWRAVLPSGTSTPADSAPNGGSILFSLPDEDADGLPDSADPCPAAPFSALNAPGWSVDDLRDGCPAPAAPFAAHRFKKAAKKAAKAFRALWRDPARRAKAMRTHRIDIRLRLPGTRRGRVEAAVVLAHPDAPRPASAFGRHRCTGGKVCVVHVKLVTEGVRAYRRKALHLVLSFAAGKRLSTSYVARLRMPL